MYREQNTKDLCTRKILSKYNEKGCSMLSSCYKKKLSICRKHTVGPRLEEFIKKLSLYISYCNRLEGIVSFKEGSICLSHKSFPTHPSLTIFPVLQIAGRKIVILRAGWKGLKCPVTVLQR